MDNRRLGAIALAVMTFGATIYAETPEPAKNAEDARKLAKRIDKHIDDQLARKGIKPAPEADDAEFIRRLYLDLGGRIPAYGEVRDFLNDQSSDKRFHKVEALLDKGLYTSHFFTFWRQLLLPPTNNQFAAADQGFNAWLRRKLADNTPYDEMVRQILTAPIAGAVRGGRGEQPAGPPTEPLPSVFFQANEFKAENLAAATSRLFLGVKLECAQCHDHPFAKWTRSQFWELAAFFSGIEPAAPNNTFQPKPENQRKREIGIAGTDKVVQARFLTGAKPNFGGETPVRTVLAEWITTAENPFFARAAANRIWSYFFGIGLIDPVDEPSDDNPPSHPELLDDLARELAAHKFDLKFLMRAIVLSKAYQRTSAQTHPSQEDVRSLARMPVRGMSPEQLFDSLVLATGFPISNLNQANRVRFDEFGNPVNARTEFLNRFTSQDRKVEQQTSILQALSLMNGKFVAELTSSDLARSSILGAVCENPFQDTSGKIETLYMLTLSRKPRPHELARLVKYVDGGGVSDDPNKALADVFWALLNSSEFFLNH